MVNELSDGRLAAEAHFDIDCTRWNAIYGASRLFKGLGMHKVHDVLSFEIWLVLSRF